MTDTWDDGGTVFTSIKMTITDTAYAAGSYMIDLTSTVAGGYFRVSPDGNIESSGSLLNPTLDGTIYWGKETGITAFAGGGQGSAYALTKSFSVIGTCATAGDSCKLPDPDGRKMTVINLGATAADLFPDTGHSIDTLAADTAITISPNGVVTLFGVSTTNWRQI